MPGVHLRTLSQFDWFNQKRDSILTIPGSYWLCYKKNIYKFIFKYHRTVKNAIKFSYGKELLKIIRRIIKCHPSQGQQFSTQHLLVTYNYTSWTRQDKMFAILKFQQKTNTAAFSHAFVLTVRICPKEESFRIKYSTVKETDPRDTFQDLSVSLDTKEKIIKPMTCTNAKISSRKMIISQTKKLNEISDCTIINDTSNEILETRVNSNFQSSIITNSVNFHESPDARMKNAATINKMHLIDEYNTKLHNNIYEARSVNNNIERNAKHSIDFMQEKSLRTCNRINEIEIKNAEDINKEIKSTVRKKQDQITLKCKIFSSIKSPVTEIIKRDVNECLSLSNSFNLAKNAIKRDDVCLSNNKDNLNNKTTRENIANSIDLPRQYFNKKKIKHDILSIDQSMQINSQLTVNDINEDIPKIVKATNNIVEKEHCSETFYLKSKGNEQHSNTQILLNGDNQSQNNMYKSYEVRKQKNKEFERKTIPKDKILRSSDITDLVMEGLMFTIKQDKDSVAVIEQKTKLEVDEVLENSEKVETKAGEKCLLNSSLLSLENLVTMIDSPREKQNKTGHANGNNAHLLPLPIFPSCAMRNLNNTNYVDRKSDKLNIFSYNRQNRMDDFMNLVPYRSQWRQCVSSDINDNTNLSVSGHLMKKDERLMEWQDNSKQDKSQMKIEKEKEDIMPDNLPSTILSEKANAKFKNINLFMDDVKQTSNYESPTENCSEPIEMYTREISAVPDKKKLPNVPTKQKLNIPTIVSDKLITVEQMSPTLQNVLQHKYRTRRFSPATISSEALQYDKNNQYSMLANMIPETSILSLENERVNSNTANKSIKSVVVNAEETKRGKDESSVTIDKNKSDFKISKNMPKETNNQHSNARNAKRKNSQTRRFSQRNSKHGSSRKLQDITEDFHYDLMQHTHNKDNTVQQKCLRQKRKSLNNLGDIKNGKIRIEMLKFIQDITEGVRVVVKRLDMNNKSNLLKKNSALATCIDM